MSQTDSMFLIEFIIESLNSKEDYNDFYIRSQFANIFSLVLNNPNLESVLPKPKKKKTKKKKSIGLKRPKKEQAQVRTGQSMVFTSDIETLLTNMIRYPMEVSIWNKAQPNRLIASTSIPWNSVFIDYLKKINNHFNVTPVSVLGEYNIFDENTSKCMAILKMNIKLTYLKHGIDTQFISDDKSSILNDTEFDSNTPIVSRDIKESPLDLTDFGLVRTIYSEGRKKFKNIAGINSDCIFKTNLSEQSTKPDFNIELNESEGADCCKKSSFMCNVKSCTFIEKEKPLKLIKSRSDSSINANMFSYLFDNSFVPYRNQLYCVGYFTVENDFNNPSDSSPSSKVDLSDKSEESKKMYKFRICKSECLSENNNCTRSVCSLDLPEEAADLITVTKCEHIKCDSKKERELAYKIDDRVLIHLSSGKCCDVIENVEITEDVQGNIQFDNEPCFCTCECTFGFSKKTTYCGVCGGYEKFGEELGRIPVVELPFPCPVYHKLIDKNKLKTWSTSGSENRRRGDDSQKSFKGSKSAQSDKKSLTEKSIDSGKKTGKKEKKDDRFKFNYGYQAPQIGHSQCAMPCSGTLSAVPKNMGWLWTADNVPGLKFRPSWRPGATSKRVVRLLRIAKNPDEAIGKKKRKDTGIKKKPLKRPLLIVEKKDGEYTVTMETIKNYFKPRAINQAPYEDKLALTYTIGRTDEENRERRRKRERAHRRLEREQREFIQSAFRDMCNEICMKTYRQALGILPDAEDPECLCYPAHPDADRTNLEHSCSCSEDKTLSTCSDTDLDEWIIEFTPPNAYFDPKYKGKKVIKVDKSNQYTYMDYRVKLVDKYGNPVPRFFKGPDGKEQCSDLGGFWGLDHNWLEINTDGYIGPDGRWAPNTFIGPSGELVETEMGKFQHKNGEWLVVGIDGYIDAQGKWKYYPKRRGAKKKHVVKTGKKGAGDVKPEYKPSETTWSCFGDASPKKLSKLGVTGHGQDKKLLYGKLQEMLARGEDVKLPQTLTVPKLARLRKVKGGNASSRTPDVYDSRSYFLDRVQCKHPVPSDKGIVAVDGRGHKTYFRLKDYKNKRPKERLQELTKQGMSLSSFHVPCLNSFVNSEMMRKEQLARLMALAAKSENIRNAATQAG